MKVLALLTLTMAPLTACVSTDAPTDSATDASTDAPNASLTVPTAAPTSASPTAAPPTAAPTSASGVVNVVMTVAGVNYTQLVANETLKNSLVDSIKAQVASATNVGVNNIEVSLSSGSVVASVTVKTDDVDTVNGSLNVNMSSLKQNVVSSISALSGIGSVTDGNITISQVQTSVVRDTAAPTSQPTASPPSLVTSTAAPDQNATGTTTVKAKTLTTGESSFASARREWAAVIVAVLVCLRA